MANPPFNLDITDPADNAIVSQFPANERTFRDNTNSYLNVEHDLNTGYHKFQVLTTTQINALSSPPTGMIVYNSTLSYMVVNTGTPASPTWLPVGGVPVGTSIEFNGTSAPAGFLVEDGSAVSRTTYAALFAAIGTTWGAGDGSTTFNLPNKQRRTSVGSGGTATGTLGNTVGSVGGEETHTLTVGESAVLTYTTSISDTHSHQYTAPIVGAPGGTFQNGGGSFNSGYPAQTSGTNSGAITASTSSNAGGAAHNNIQPSAVVLKCIKY